MNLTDPHELQSLLKRHGFRFSKAMGQNFLIASWVPERIAEAASLSKQDCVVEIGPGIGTLTTALAARADKVLAIELDMTLEPILRKTLADIPNVELVFADALKTDLRELTQRHFGDKPVKLCANLPYNVTSPLMTAFLKADCFRELTVMVQKEVANRFCAEPGTKEYGSFTVFINWYTEPSICFDVAPDCFMPSPKVTSSVVTLRRRAQPAAYVIDEIFFFRIVRASFSQRRKTLPNALSAGIAGLSKEAAVEAMNAAGIDTMARGETLSLRRFAELSNILISKISW